MVCVVACHHAWLLVVTEPVSLMQCNACFTIFNTAAQDAQYKRLGEGSNDTDSSNSTGMQSGSSAGVRMQVGRWPATAPPN